ncbi:ferritin-like domain-containing protein [Streptomyces sp. NPDC059534]|uniref:ferritin-like domain-containing protein n=1 Tax=Streptomyces sp. NPDC059534 TaxID=3346859 RepID=UPI00368644BB
MIVQQTSPEDELEPMVLLNAYRAAEVHGAGAIMRLGRLADNAQLRKDLSRHLRDEAVHAWLWSKAIHEMGGEIHEVDEPYQTVLAQQFGIPRSLNELLALTWVSERRGCAQYEEHLEMKEIPASIRRTLRGILKDEIWHVGYIREELDRRALKDPAVEGIIERAILADERAMVELSSTGVFDALNKAPGA